MHEPGASVWWKTTHPRLETEFEQTRHFGSAAASYPCRHLKFDSTQSSQASTDTTTSLEQLTRLCPTAKSVQTRRY